MNIADTIVYLKNRSPSTAVATTPFELWYGTKPDISHLRIIGSTVYVHVPKEKQIKLDTHSNKGIQLGYGRARANRSTGSIAGTADRGTRTTGIHQGQQRYFDLDSIQRRAIRRGTRTSTYRQTCMK